MAVRRQVERTRLITYTQDEQNYQKAEKEAYLSIADALDVAGFDEISIEDAHRPNDLSLFQRFKKTKVCERYACPQGLCFVHLRRAVRAEKLSSPTTLLFPPRLGGAAYNIHLP